MNRTLLTLLLTALLAVAAVAAEPAATWSFSAGEAGTCPRTIAVQGNKLVVDLSAVPQSAKVFRAVLNLDRRDYRPNRDVNEPVIIVPAGDEAKPLPLLGPRFTSLDATAAVGGRGKGKLELTLKRGKGIRLESARLDVAMTGAPAKGKLPAAGNLVARHRDGQTMLTWTEEQPLTSEEVIDLDTWHKLKAAMDKERRLRYRVYRSDKPITPATIAAAELIDEVEPMTCWNRWYHGQHARYDKDRLVKLARYVVEDGAKPVGTDTGLHAHNPAKAGKAYYAVTVAVDGAEDFAAAATAGPVEETVGDGPFILQRELTDQTFCYVKGVTLRYYVRWEGPPRCNLPATPYDYLVAAPANLKKPAPLQVSLHCWGGTLNSGFGGWHGGREGALMISTNQIPYDWWVAYHEDLHTWKPWADGVCRDFTPKRYWAFLDWVRARWAVDDNRIYLVGGSMGGAGASMLALRYPERLAFSLSTVGVHNAADSHQFRSSYEGVCGLVARKLQHESGMMVWDYLSNTHLLNVNPARDMPLLVFGNGKDDHGIGWEQALGFAKACQAARQPHTFGWNLGGHTARLYMPPVDVRRDRSLPAFTRCSLDDDPGTAAKLPQPTTYPDGKYIRKDLYDGKPSGQFNGYLTWDADGLIDEPGRWEVTVSLLDGKPRKAPKDTCTVDVTPRRCRQFTAKAGQKFAWTNTAVASKEIVARGEVAADKYGQVTVPQTTVTKTGNRLTITAQ